MFNSFGDFLVVMDKFFIEVNGKIKAILNKLSGHTVLQYLYSASVQGLLSKW